MTSPKTEYRLPFVTEMEIRFGDADAIGHVNNVAFFRFLEQGRVHFMKAGKGNLSGSGIRDFPYVVAHSELDFVAPLAYDDIVVITMGIGRIGGSSFVFDYELFSKRSGVMAAKGNVVMVCFDHDNNRSMPIPEEFRSTLKEYLTDPV